MTPHKIVSFLPLLFAAACGGDPGTSMDPPDRPPEGRPERLTLSGELRLDPGSERYQCYLVRWKRPGGLRIRRVVPQGGEAVHHIGVFTDLLGSEQQETRPCEEMGLWGFIYGGGVGTGALELPAGSAMHVEEGTPLILQVHFLNSGGQPTAARASVDLELAAAGESLAAVGSFIVGTTRIELPPMTRMDVTGTCTRHPLMERVFAAFPHMHRLGTALRVTSGGDPAQPVFDLPQWDFGDQGMLRIDPVMRIPENQPIVTRCSYYNTTQRTVRMGLHTGDEMCIAVLYYWPAVGQSGLSVCQR